MKYQIMLLILSLLPTALFSQGFPVPVTPDRDQAFRFTNKALECIVTEYPYLPEEVISNNTGLCSPKEIHPAFYGCFSRSNAIQAHWMLVKLLREFPDLPNAKAIREVLNRNLSKDHLQKEKNALGETVYFIPETIYSYAWILKLSEMLADWDDQDAVKWRKNLQPLTDDVVNRFIVLLTKTENPDRSGKRTNTAFAMSFAWDYAVNTGQSFLKEVIENRAMEFYLNNPACPDNVTPGDNDILSPCLTEACLMERVLPAELFGAWIDGFMPGLKSGESKRFTNLTENDHEISAGQNTLPALNLMRSACFFRLSKVLDNPSIPEAALNYLSTPLLNTSSRSYITQQWLMPLVIYAEYAAIEETVPSFIKH
jgi:hypothetical protein